MEQSVSKRCFKVPSRSIWEQIEDEREVGIVLARLRSSKRTAVYSCPDLYELAYPGYPGDRDFYLSETKSGSVLYLGVGTGRIFAPMVAQNSRVCGVEYSPEMCCVLSHRLPQIADRLLQCDAAEAPVETASLDTVVAPYSFLQVVGRAQLSHLLSRVHSWLKPGGRFVTDTFSPYEIPFRRRGLEANIRRINEQTRVATYVQYDHLAQRMQEFAFIDHTGKAPCVLEMHLDYYFPREVIHAIESAGFDPVSIRGGYGGEPFDPSGSEIIVYEAVKPGCSTNEGLA